MIQQFLIIFLSLRLIVCQVASPTYFTEIEKCKFTSHGGEYIGNISETKSGKRCVQWKKSLLESLKLQESEFSDKDFVLNHNYCRNPNLLTNGPWCIVDENSLKWEYCDIKICKKERNWCKDTESGEEYFGKISITKSGKSCKLWSDQTNFNGDLFPEGNLIDAENKCRNPDRKSSGPWCYIDNEFKNWEECTIPFCNKDFSQIEYFGGYDILINIENFNKRLRFKDVYENVTFSISVTESLWNSNIQRKSSLWATDYDPNCQTDLNEYEYCKSSKPIAKNEKLIIVYQCLRLVKNLIFISPLEKSQYKSDYQLGKLFEINLELNEDFLQYKRKFTQYINQRNKNEISIPLCENAGSFFLLNDNAIPYAISSENKSVFIISEIGKGRIGFMSCDIFVKKESQSVVKDFLSAVYDDNQIIPVELTRKVLKNLDLLRNKGETFSTALIWNAHDIIGISYTNLLLDLVRDGLKIVIGIKPWAYELYTSNFHESELKPLFIAAGIWPSIGSINGNAKVVTNEIIPIFPLVHLLNFAQSNLSNVLAISPTVRSVLLELELDNLINLSQFENIRNLIKSLILLYSPKIKSLIPCFKKPLTNENDKSIISFINVLLLQSVRKETIAPGVSFFPGKLYSNDIELISIKMELYLKFSAEVYQLGLYLPPGTEASINIIRSNSSNCYLYINHHLFNVINSESYRKWPITNKRIIVSINKLTSFSFSFGGLLSLSCFNDSDTVELTLSGVTRVPVFDRRDWEMNKHWGKLHQSHVPWAVVSSDCIVFILPFSGIRNLAQPNITLELYDSMVKEEFHLVGRSMEKYPREIISADIQIEIGFMNSGYPIGIMIYYTTNPDLKSDYLFNIYDIKQNGRWGILHEIGHNLQPSIYTFSGTTEVTNNIFTLVGTESMTGKSSWAPESSWIPSQTSLDTLVDYLRTGNFVLWQNNPFVALSIFAQMRSHFGWELYSQLFRSSNINNDKLNEISNSEKIHLWINETSNRVAMNLCPLYDLWKWPIEEKTKKSVSVFPKFLPDDFLTKLVPNQIDEIIRKYGGVESVNRKPLRIPQIIGPLNDKLSIDGARIIKQIKIEQMI